MTADEVRALLRGRVLQAGSQAKLAAEFEVSETHLSDILNGRRPPGY